MNETYLIKTTLPSVTSSFSYATFNLYKSKSKRIFNSQLSTKIKLSKKSNIVSSLR